MANEPIPNNPSDDELETLAEDLFGVNLNQDQGDIEPFDVGAFDLDDDEPATVEDSTSAADASPEVSSTKAFVSDDEVDDFGAMLLDDDDAPPPPARVVATSVDPDEPTGIAASTADAEDEQPDSSTSAGDEDDYWDALEGFDWGEEGDEKKGPAVASRKEYVEATETFEDLSIESAEKTDEFLDDVEFGAGLDDDSDVPAPSPSSTTTESDDTTERKGRRRRGGRRRGRRGRSRDDASADQQQDSSPSAQPAPEKDKADSKRPTAAPVIEDDGFGAGLEVEASEQAGAEEQPAEEQPRKRRRRGGRRRGRRKPQEAQSEQTSAGAEAAPSSDPDQKSTSTERDEEESRSREDKYRSVPTWEEAISYLIRREPKKTGEGQKSGSGSRRGRRGSGRRRS